MSITGTRGEARGRNLSSGAFFFPKEEEKAPPVTFGVVAIWLFALAFGVAFWAVLFRVASAIVGQIY
jgi:hypothetical protein